MCGGVYLYPYLYLFEGALPSLGEFRTALRPQRTTAE
jgi:hypothetical protein